MHAGTCQFRIEPKGSRNYRLQAARQKQAGVESFTTDFDNLRQAIIYRSGRMNTNTCLAGDRMTSGVRFTFAQD